MKTENDLLKELYQKRPKTAEGINNPLIYVRGSGKKMEYNMFSWITGNPSDVWVSFAYIDSKLKKFGYNSQLYYDVVVLGIDSIDKRPVCRYCGKPTKFKSLSRGYFDFCNLSCTAKWGNRVPSKIENVRKALTGKKLSKAHKHSLSLGAIRRIIRTGAKNGIYKSKHGKYKPNKSNSTLYYDSSWELLFMKLMDKYKLAASINRVDFKIPYKDKEGNERNYIPDFLVVLNNGLKILIEIKPKRLRFSLRNFEKSLYGRKYCYKNGLKYVLLTEDELFSKQAKSGWLDLFNYFI